MSNIPHIYGIRQYFTRAIWLGTSMVYWPIWHLTLGTSPSSTPLPSPGSGPGGSVRPYYQFGVLKCAPSAHLGSFARTGSDVVTDPLVPATKIITRYYFKLLVCIRLCLLTLSIWLRSVIKSNSSCFASWTRLSLFSSPFPDIFSIASQVGFCGLDQPTTLLLYPSAPPELGVA